MIWCAYWMPNTGSARGRSKLSHGLSVWSRLGGWYWSTKYRTQACSLWIDQENDT